jgi:hypothetical protein
MFASELVQSRLVCAWWRQELAATDGFIPRLFDGLVIGIMILLELCGETTALHRFAATQLLLTEGLRKSRKVP